MALVAVGGYGRAELAPGSDLDVLLLHDGSACIGTVTETLWYPVWDAKAQARPRRAHPSRRRCGWPPTTSTRPRRCCPSATWPATRSLTGDLADGARSAVEQAVQARGWTGVRRGVDQRHAAARRGGLPARARPEGGAGRAARRPRPVGGPSWPPTTLLAEGDDEALRDAYDVLLAARVELHRLHRPPGRRPAARRTRTPWPPARLRRRRRAHGRGQRRGPDDLVDQRRGLVPGDASLQGQFGSWDGATAGRRPRRQRSAIGEVRLDDDADPARDPTLLLRAAPPPRPGKRLRIDRSTLDRLAAEMPTWPDPWPAGASDELVALLLEGHDAIPVPRVARPAGSVTRLLPEWAAGAVASPSATPTTASPSTGTCGRRRPTRPTSPTGSPARPPRARCAPPRPRQGLPGRPHRRRRRPGRARSAPRMGSVRSTTSACWPALVRHHLLLPDVATRRDLSDDGTIERGGRRGRRRRGC